MGGKGEHERNYIPMIPDEIKEVWGEGGRERERERDREGRERKREKKEKKRKKGGRKK